ncbi:hypothetical protein TrispH2_009939 [Trichoplax sp. H2]|nr:hypothetical protein TrispH2_009939 [Trichoplax sp. H2]|eukprot:RDD38462.1 hypothetical protein TrispH2_009939 [Trichoplax sp. H2]
MSHKICLHLSILAALAIICQARLIQRNDDFDIHERDELSPEKSAMKNLPWQNIRHDVDDDKEYMALKSKRDAYEKGQEILSNTDLTQPIHVNPLKDYLYRADDKSNQKILYCKYDGLCTSDVQCCTKKCISVGNNSKECVGISGALIFFK